MAEKTNVETRNVKEWCEDFEKLYGKADSARSPEDLWVATMGHCSGVGEGIRRVNYNELIRSAAHAFCWMCSYINLCNKTEDLLFRFDHSLCDIVYLKYPGRCGYCRELPCKCNPYEMDEKQDKTARYEKLYEKWEAVTPITYDMGQWMGSFRDLYGGRIHQMSLESIGFHFLEEAGEKTTAVRQLVQLRNVVSSNIEGVDKKFLERLRTMKTLIEEHSICLKDTNLKRDPQSNKPIINYASKEPVHIKARIAKAKMNFVVELADTFSWFCGILIKLDLIAISNGITDGRFDIERKLQEIYGVGGKPLSCPECKKNVCECVFFT